MSRVLTTFPSFFSCSCGAGFIRVFTGPPLPEVPDPSGSRGLKRIYETQRYHYRKLSIIKIKIYLNIKKIYTIVDLFNFMFQFNPLTV